MHDEMEFRSVLEILDEDAFEIHGMMFNIKEVIQCAFLCNESLYMHHINNEFNSYLISIKKKSRSIVVSPSIMGSELAARLMHNHKDSTELKQFIESKNSYMKSADDCIILLTKGFVSDNFKVKFSPMLDFSVEDSGCIYMTGEDIEDLTCADPEIV